jgi:hypothetical protein
MDVNNGTEAENLTNYLKSVSLNPASGTGRKKMVRKISMVGFL